MTSRATRYVTSLLMMTALAGCHHHHSNSAPPNPTTYTVGGSISGLTASGLVLANGSMSVSPAAAATSFTFGTQVVSGASYDVTVTTQPAGQTCTIANASGTVAAANVTNVLVACTTNMYSVGGTISGLSSGGLVLANNADTFSVTAGATSFTMPTTLAGGAMYAVTVKTQPSGESCTVSNGSGTIASANVTNVGVTCILTPPPTLSWVWRSGANTVNASGVYGTQGLTATSNVPGARGGKRPVSWTDGSGNLWLFGGFGHDSSGALGILNDLWKYSPTTGQWTWKSGSNTGMISGSYGTRGIPSANNVPGARGNASSWVDGAGNLWLFGGQGYDSTGALDLLNDLWKYSPSSGQWTWMSGSNTAAGASAAYGTQGTAAAGNVPGGRYSSVSWTDAAGNFWLFGGFGRDSGALKDFNDLWEYNPNTGQWTWVSGSNTGGASGVYGIQGTAAAGNAPGARDSAVSWTDGAGNFWLFGGDGLGATGPGGRLNDLWKYSTGTGQWTWVSGSTSGGAQGVYGNQGTAAAGNTPGARRQAISWTDNGGNLWLFGGYGVDSGGANSDLNDLWQYNPTTGQWTWMSGSNVSGASGVYGVQGTAASGNVPGARDSAVAWVDSANNLWLFGGVGYDSNGAFNNLNDLWEFPRN